MTTSLWARIEKVATSNGWKPSPAIGAPDSMLLRRGGVRITVQFIDKQHAKIHRAVARTSTSQPFEVWPSFEAIRDLLTEEAR